MATPERIYRASVRAFSLVFVAFGLAILVTTLAAGGGPLSVGVLLGLAFLAVGVARLWAASRVGTHSGREPEPPSGAGRGRGRIE